MFSYPRDARTRAGGAYTSRLFLGIYLGEQEARDEKEDGCGGKVDICNGQVDTCIRDVSARDPDPLLIEQTETADMDAAVS